MTARTPPAQQPRIEQAIKELERRKTLYAIPGPEYSVGKVDGFDEAIALLRGGEQHG